MARISTYTIDTNVTGSDKWIGSDADNGNITKNFTPAGVASYFNKTSSIDTGQFSWQYQAETSSQSQKTFLKVGYTEGTININALAGVIRVSNTTLANTTPGIFIDNEWVCSTILVHIPNAPSSYSIYTVTNVVLDGDFYLLSLSFIDGTSYVISAADPVIFGIFSTSSRWTS